MPKDWDDFVLSFEVVVLLELETVVLVAGFVAEDIALMPLGLLLLELLEEVTSFTSFSSSSLSSRTTTIGVFAATAGVEAVAPGVAVNSGAAAEVSAGFSTV